MIEAFTDSSYDAKRNIAGIGIVFNKGIKERSISNFVKASSNNYGEMFAIYVAAIILHGKDATIYTDSQTALQYIDDNIKDKPRTHQQYIEHMHMKMMAYKIRRLGVSVAKVKAHSSAYKDKNIHNNMADLLAKYGRSKAYVK
jgi:ribonuclease HI